MAPEAVPVAPDAVPVVPIAVIRLVEKHIGITVDILGRCASQGKDITLVFSVILAFQR